MDLTKGSRAREAVITGELENVTKGERENVKQQKETMVTKEEGMQQWT